MLLAPTWSFQGEWRESYKTGSTLFTIRFLEVTHRDLVDIAEKFLVRKHLIPYVWRMKKFSLHHFLAILGIQWNSVLPAGNQKYTQTVASSDSAPGGFHFFRSLALRSRKFLTKIPEDVKHSGILYNRVTKSNSEKHREAFNLNGLKPTWWKF